MNSNVLVSVIVPLYNVERYLTECVDSILNQDYKNLQILLINDGSPDKSGEIAETFSEIDGRIEVFHRLNEGVSNTRNFGLTKAKGSFVVFVDSDDVLLPSFISYMINIVNTTGADFGMSKQVATSIKEESITVNELFDILSPEDATCALLYPDIAIGCWNKIYKTSFLKDNNITFPTNFYMGEGLNFITTVSQLANKVGVGKKKVYYYRTDNADSATTKFDIKKLDNAFKAIDNINLNLVLKTAKVRKALNFHLWWTNFYALQLVIASRQEDKFIKEVNLYCSFLKQNAYDIFKADVSIKMRIKIILIGISPLLTVKSLIFLRKIS
jgi:glycosyltransferase involved in cell wall biosynthesis